MSEEKRARFFSTFLKGLFALLPIMLSIYLIFWLFNLTESMAQQFLLWFWPQTIYFPGLGVIAFVVFVYFFGRLLSNRLIARLFERVENVFTILPLVKSVYASIKDLMAYLSPKKDGDASQIVLVRFPSLGVELVGLMTRTDLNDLPEGVSKEDRVAVYLPMSYQIGGYTVFVPRSQITPINMGVEPAMRSILTAWLPARRSNVSNDKPVQ